MNKINSFFCITILVLFYSDCGLGKNYPDWQEIIEEEEIYEESDCQEEEITEYEEYIDVKPFDLKLDSDEKTSLCYCKCS